jgi:hypothetical protein
MDE